MKAIVNRSLLEKAEDTGAYLRNELGRVGEKRGIITNVRGMQHTSILLGQGTFIGFDVTGGPKEADSLVKFLKYRRIHVGFCENASIGLRPALILEPIQAKHLLDALYEYPKRSPYPDFGINKF